MSGLTTKLQLYKPGGGLSGLITPDEIADIDRLNSNFDLIDLSTGFRNVTSGTRPLTPYDGLPIYESDTTRIRIWNNAAGQWLAPGAERGGSTDYSIADLDSLAGIVDALPGDVVNVRSALGWAFMRNSANTTWVQIAPGIFANSAARTTEFAKAAGAYLINGAQSLQTDVNNALFEYNGTAWQAKLAWTPIRPTSVTGALASLVGNIMTFAANTVGGVANGVFTSNFNQYRVVYALDVAAPDSVNAQLVAATVVDTTGNYDVTANSTSSAGAVGGQTLAAGSWSIGASTTSRKHVGELTLFSPAVAASTQGMANVLGLTNPMAAGVSNTIAQKGFLHRLTAAYDGIKIIPASGTAMTGTVKFFGITDL